MSFEPNDHEQPRRSTLRLLLQLFLILLIVGGMLGSAISGVVWFLRQRPTPAAVNEESTVTPTAPAREDVLVPTPEETETPDDSGINRIAFITPDGRLATIDPQGRDERLLTGEDLTVQFPAWSPDGQFIAVVGGDGSGLGVYVVGDQARENQPEELYFSRTQTPFYLYWSPDGRHLSFLANHPTDFIGLHLVSVRGQEPSRLLATGSPFYWDWTADGEQLLIHTGPNGEESRLALIDADSGDPDQDIAPPGFFQAPGISASGRYLAYAEETGPGISQLIVADTQTGEQRQERHAGSIAMGWSPTRDELAVISSRREEGRFYGPLRLFNARTGEVRLLSSDTVLAFFWSPNGRYIAIISIPGESDDIHAQSLPKDGGMRLVRSMLTGNHGGSSQVAQQPSPHQANLSVVEVENGRQKFLLAPFEPTGLFIAQFLPFFDQYALSHRLWAPESDALVVPTRQDGTNGIFVVPVSGKDPLRLTDGDMPFWSWQ